MASILVYAANEATLAGSVGLPEMELASTDPLC